MRRLYLDLVLLLNMKGHPIRRRRSYRTRATRRNNWHLAPLARRGTQSHRHSKQNHQRQRMLAIKSRSRLRLSSALHATQPHQHLARCYRQAAAERVASTGSSRKGSGFYPRPAPPAPVRPSRSVSNLKAHHSPPPRGQPGSHPRNEHPRLLWPRPKLNRPRRRSLARRGTHLRRRQGQQVHDLNQSQSLIQTLVILSD